LPAAPVAAIPAVALPGAPDPVYALIEAHREIWTRRWAFSAELLRREARARKNEPEPYALIHWRNYHIGGSELDDMRERLLNADVKPAIVEREYQDAQRRYANAVRRCQEWSERNGLGPAREMGEGLIKAEDDAVVALTNVRPTTIGGIVALLAYVDEFNRGGMTVPSEPSYYSEHELWPDNITDDDSLTLRGEPLEMPFPYWVMRNVQAALTALAVRS
jgi:hypothetical protein